MMDKLYQVVCWLARDCASQGQSVTRSISHRSVHGRVASPSMNYVKDVL